MIIKNVIKSIVKHKLSLPVYPYFVTYLVTERCNLKCVFCDVWKNQDMKRSEMPLQDIETVFKKIRKSDVIRFSGGEPFIRDDFSKIVLLAERIISPDMIHITTNGFFTERIVNLFQLLKEPRKIHIKLSIDAIGDKHDLLRGVTGVYERSFATLKNLVRMRKYLGFVLGVNSVIPDASNMRNFLELKKIMDEYDVPVYSVIASLPKNALYSKLQYVSPDTSTAPMGVFSSIELKEYFDFAEKDLKGKDDFFERIVDNYHIKGLKNRMLYNKQYPKPKCVALSSHLRILPNGDVPVCLYNSEIVGNLLRQELYEIWGSSKIKNARKFVNNCKGCWQSCESLVSAIYTGDIYKGLFVCSKQ